MSFYQVVCLSVLCLSVTLLEGQLDFKGGVFSEPIVFLGTLSTRLAPHELTHMSGHHLATVRRAGRKRGARFESTEALAEQPAVARRLAVEFHPLSSLDPPLMFLSWFLSTRTTRTRSR